MTLPIYVINLDRRPDRLEAITADLDRLGLQFERIQAIDGEELPDRQSPVRLLTTAEWGCLASHCLALKQFLATPHPAALILEDDAGVASDILPCLDSTYWWPEGTRLVKLEISVERRRPLGDQLTTAPNGRGLYAVVSPLGGAAGYLVDRGGAAMVLDACDDKALYLPYDHVLFDTVRSRVVRKLRPVLMVPTLVRQSLSPSDLAPRRNRAKWRGRLYRARRNPWMMFHRIGIVCRQASGRVRRVPIHWVDKL